MFGDHAEFWSPVLHIILSSGTAVYLMDCIFTPEAGTDLIVHNQRYLCVICLLICPFLLQCNTYLYLLAR